MPDIKWIKISVDIFDNRKVKQIEKLPDGDRVIAIWFKILCLAGVVNDNGLIYLTRDIPYTEQTLATEFNRPLEIIQLALSVFQKFEMIEIVDELIRVTNWEKYQNADGLERIREQNRIRTANYRARLAAPRDITCDVTVTPRDGIDKEIDIEIDKEKKIRTHNAPASRHVRGQHGYVKLTDEEHARLVQDLGQAELDRVIYYVDESAAATGNKNKWKDWNLVLRKASREKWGARGQQQNKGVIDNEQRYSTEGLRTSL